MAVHQTTGLLNRPMLFIAGAFIAGSLAGLYNSSLPLSLISAYCVVALLLFVISMLCRSRCSRYVRNASGLMLILLAGLFRGVIGGAGIVSSEDLVTRAVVLEGVVDSDPEWGLGGAGRRKRLYFDLLTPAGEVVNIALTARGAGRVEYGDSMRLRGYRRVAGGGRLFFSGWIDGDGLLSKGGGSSFKRWLYGIRRDAGRKLSFGISEFQEESGILKALVLGYRRGIGDTVKEDFIATGALHIFAISGLHVGIVCGFAVFLFKVLRLSPGRWFPVLLVILISYTMMTGASTSAVRACTMALVFYGGIFAGRKPDFLSALAVTALLLAAYDPLNLHDAGFLLSFTVVGGIFLLGGAITDAVSILRESDSFLVPGLRTAESGLISWLTGLAAVSVSAWLFSAPLMLFFFGRISITGIISNMIVVPFAFLIVLSGCCSLVAGQISMLFADVFNHASLALIFLLKSVIKWFAEVPYGDIREVEFGAVQVWLSYAFLACLTLLLKRLSLSRKIRLKIV